MKTIFLSHSDPSGKSGNNISTKEIISALGRNEKVSKLAVICPKPNEKIPEEIKQYLNSKFYLPAKPKKSPIWHLKCQLKITNIIRKNKLYEKYDVLLARKSLLMIVPGILGKFYLPLYYLIRGIGSESVKNNRLVWLHNKTFGKLQDKFLAKNSRKIFIAYKEVEKSLNKIASKKLLQNKIEYFPNAVNPELFKTGSKLEARKIINNEHEYNYSKEDFIIGFAGSIKERHCLFELIEGFKLALRKNKFSENNIKILLVGDGPYLESLKKLTHDYGLLDRINFPGFVPHNKVSLFINACDILYGVVHPKYPSNPIKCYEYLSCERPIITTKKEEFNFVENLRCGFILDCIKPGDISEKIIEAYSKEQKTLDRMGIRGREYVINNHTWSSLIDKIYNDFSNMMKG